MNANINKSISRSEGHGVELAPLFRSDVQMQQQQQQQQQPREGESKCLNMLGVSVYHLLTDFMAQIREAGCDPDSKIYEIEDLSCESHGAIRRRGANIICPIDGRRGASYVNSLSGEDHVGRANFMLSYSWGYSIGDVLDSITGFCKSHGRDPKRTYIWICCLCVNQHRVVENRNSGKNIPPEEFFAEFGERVTGIGCILAMMAPWGNPAYLTRVWCIYELYTAHMEGCEVEIIMPVAQKKSLKEDLFGSTGKRNNNLDILYHVLAKTRVQDAQASVEIDRTTILDLVKVSPGYKILNDRVNELLRGWVQGVVRELIEGAEDIHNSTSRTAEGGCFAMVSKICCRGNHSKKSIQYAALCNDVGLLFRRNGELDAALDLWRKSLFIRESVLGTSHPDTADSCNNIGGALQAKGQFDQALRMYQKALVVQNAALGPNHPSAALSYNNIGSVLKAKGNQAEALRMYRKALQIRTFNLGPKSPLTATCYNNIGSILKTQGQYSEALQMYRMAMQIKLGELGANHPDTATAYNNVGSVLKAKGEETRALCMYKKALAIEESVLGASHPSTARSHNNIGSILYSNRQYNEALVEFGKAKTIHKLALGDNHPTTAFSHINIGSVLYGNKEYSKALVEFQKALTIQETVLGPKHPDTKSTKERIGRAMAHKLLIRPIRDQVCNNVQP